MVAITEVTNTNSVDPNTHIVVVTKDEKKHALPRDAVRMVKLIQELLPDDDQTSVLEIPLPEVDSDTLQCIWDYLDLYRTIEPEKLEKPLKDDLKNLIPPVDWTYITTVLLEDGDEKKHDKVFSTLKAANFMNIEPLRDLCCATIANMLRGKNETEILSLFGILEPFTPDEEEKLFQEYEWLREKKD